MKLTAEEALSERLKTSLTSSYQTMLGIIQGGALGYLTLTVIDELRQRPLGVMQWWVTFVTFFVLVFTWYTITMDTTTWTWIPGLRDALIPFAIGVYEVGLIYTTTLAVTTGLRPWLCGMALGPLFAFLGFHHTMEHARNELEYVRLLHVLRRSITLRFRCNVIVIIAQLLAAAIGLLLPFGGLSVKDIPVAIGVLILIPATLPLAFFFVVVAKYWQAVAATARKRHD